MCQPFLLDLSGRGISQSDLLKLGMEIYSYNDHRSAPFSRACWLVLPPPTLLRVREPTLSWNQFHSSTFRLVSVFESLKEMDSERAQRSPRRRRSAPRASPNRDSTHRRRCPD